MISTNRLILRLPSCSAPSQPCPLPVGSLFGRQAPGCTTQGLPSPNDTSVIGHPSRLCYVRALLEAHASVTRYRSRVGVSGIRER